jgi:hypothetical protein
MQAINSPYFLGLDQLLRRQPADDSAWQAVQAQALLIAENGNLLLLRPPEKGAAAWSELATSLRTRAAAVARAAGQKDYNRSRQALTDLASVCNRCHQANRVSVRATAFSDEPIHAAGGRPTRTAPPAPPALPPPPSPPQPPAVPRPPLPP